MVVDTLQVDGELAVSQRLKFSWLHKALFAVSDIHFHFWHN